VRVSLDSFLALPEDLLWMVDEERIPEPTSRRTQKRIAAEFRCTIFDGEVKRYARVANLSAGGARIITAAPPAIGKTVTLTIFLAPTKKEITSRAVIVWRAEGIHGRGGFIGVRFDDISDRDAIVAFTTAAEPERVK